MLCVFAPFSFFSDMFRRGTGGERTRQGELRLEDQRQRQQLKISTGG